MNDRRMPAALLVLIDIVLICAVLVVFALFHHVIPRESLKTPTMIVSGSGSDISRPSEAVSDCETFVQYDDTNAPWRRKYELHFSDAPVWTQDSYRSPDISVSVRTFTEGEEKNKMTYHVADIYISKIECFQTYLAKGKYGYAITQSVLDMASASDAIVAISGDYYGNTRNNGVVIRNGLLYRAQTTDADICVLYSDGVMETFKSTEFNIDEVTARGAYQAWTFGPALINPDGSAVTKFTGYAKNISVANPRSAVGYFEPGHYCFVTVDGRQPDYSNGARMERLAKIFADLGCRAAYNLDGGQSAIMSFRDKLYSHPYKGGRNVSDIILIREVS